jgi:hypothetical protein
VSCISVTDPLTHNDAIFANLLLVTSDLISISMVESGIALAILASADSRDHRLLGTTLSFCILDFAKSTFYVSHLDDTVSRQMAE